MRIAIGSDHAAFVLKNIIRKYLEELGHEVTDFGTNSQESIDYPDIAILVTEAVSTAKVARGILLCRTGIGMSIVANKLPNIRAAHCCSIEQAQLSSEHNQANVLCFGGSVNEEEAKAMVKIWLETPFGWERHLRRINKISEIEKKYLKNIE